MEKRTTHIQSITGHREHEHDIVEQPIELPPRCRNAMSINNLDDDQQRTPFTNETPTVTMNHSGMITTDTDAPTGDGSVRTTLDTSIEAAVDRL
jgi:hypothetical protein